MTNIAKPIIKQIKDNREALDYFENIVLPADTGNHCEFSNGLYSQLAGLRRF